MAIIDGKLKKDSGGKNFVFKMILSKSLSSTVKIAFQWISKFPNSYRRGFSQDKYHVTTQVCAVTNFVCRFFKRKIVKNLE